MLRRYSVPAFSISWGDTEGRMGTRSSAPGSGGSQGPGGTGACASTVPLRRKRPAPTLPALDHNVRPDRMKNMIGT
jgi:hypothetical protein